MGIGRTVDNACYGEETGADLPNESIVDVSPSQMTRCRALQQLGFLYLPFAFYSYRIHLRDAKWTLSAAGLPSSYILDLQWPIAL